MCFLTLPGSFCGRGTFLKHLFSDRLWRMEFCCCGTEGGQAGGCSSRKSHHNNPTDDRHDGRALTFHPRPARL